MTALFQSRLMQATEAQLCGSLKATLADLADSLATKVSIVISNDVKSRPTATNAIRNVVKEHMPALLEEEFTRGFLQTKDGARKQRAMLLHLLELVEAKVTHNSHTALSTAKSIRHSGGEARHDSSVGRGHAKHARNSGESAGVVHPAFKSLQTVTTVSHRLGLYDFELNGAASAPKRCY